jgi:hypothetical protein
VVTQLKNVQAMMKAESEVELRKMAPPLPSLVQPSKRVSTIEAFAGVEKTARVQAEAERATKEGNNIEVM